jgi:hypothetical protein
MRVRPGTCSTKGLALAGFFLANELRHPQRHHNTTPRTGRPPCGRSGPDPHDRIGHVDRLHQHAPNRGEQQLVQLRHHFIHGAGLSTTPPSNRAFFGRTPPASHEDQQLPCVHAHTKGTRAVPREQCHTGDGEFRTLTQNPDFRFEGPGTERYGLRHELLEIDEEGPRVRITALLDPPRTITSTSRAARSTKPHWLPSPLTDVTWEPGSRRPRRHRDVRRKLLGGLAGQPLAHPPPLPCCVRASSGAIAVSGPAGL